jgi:predicted sulfurtransferase
VCLSENIDNAFESVIEAINQKIMKKTGNIFISEDQYIIEFNQIKQMTTNIEYGIRKQFHNAKKRLKKDIILMDLQKNQFIGADK